MSIGEISTKVYGTSARSWDILQINDIPDALNILRNTPVKYYDDSAGSGV